MSITINGNGTISGISSGGLPAGSITSATLADDAVTASKLGVKAFINVAYLVDEKGVDFMSEAVLLHGLISDNENNVGNISLQFIPDK